MGLSVTNFNRIFRFLKDFVRVLKKKNESFFKMEYSVKISNGKTQNSFISNLKEGRGGLPFRLKFEIYCHYTISRENVV